MRGGETLYIGKTGSMFGRFAHHNAITREAIREGDEIEFIFCSQDELDKLECSMIAEFNPPMNKRAGGGGRPIGGKEDIMTKLVKSTLDTNKTRREKRQMDAVFRRILNE